MQLANIRNTSHWRIYEVPRDAFTRYNFFQFHLVFQKNSDIGNTGSATTSLFEIHLFIHYTTDVLE